MTIQLLQEYRFVQANGPESERRWRKSLTPYQRTVLDRALAAEVEQQAHPLPSDPEPVTAPSSVFQVITGAQAPRGPAAQFQALTDAQAIDWILRSCGVEPSAPPPLPSDDQLVWEDVSAAFNALEPLTFPEPAPRRSFRDGLRRPWWERRR